jgi:hypothetical protein
MTLQDSGVFAHSYIDLVIYIYLYVSLEITACESKGFEIHSFQSSGVQMAVRLPAFDISCPKHPERFLVLICIRGRVSLRNIVQLEPSNL